MYLPLVDATLLTRLRANVLQFLLQPFLDANITSRATFDDQH